MGHRYSHLKVEAEASLGAGVPPVDVLTLAYRTQGCWRGRRRLARFTFPRRGWTGSREQQACRAREQRRLALDELQRLDAGTAVTVKCLSEGATLYKAAAPLARLLAYLEGAVGGDAALLLLTLAGGGDAAGRGGVASASLSFTRPRYFRLWSWSHDDRAEVHAALGDAACLGHKEPHGAARPDEAAKDQSQEQWAAAEVWCPQWFTPPAPSPTPTPSTEADSNTASSAGSLDAEPESYGVLRRCPALHCLPDLGSASHYEGASASSAESLDAEPESYGVLRRCPAMHCLPDLSSASLSSASQSYSAERELPEHNAHPGQEDPAAGAQQASGTVAGEDTVEAASGVQEESCPGVGRPRVHTLLGVLAALHLVSCFLLLYTAWR